MFYVFMPAIRSNLWQIKYIYFIDQRIIRIKVISKEITPDLYVFDKSLFGIFDIKTNYFDM